MSSLFHNPYHFVPYGTGVHPHGITLTMDPATQSRQPENWPSHLTHAQYASGAKSGRIVCRIEVKELLAVGAQQTGGDEPKKGQPATVRKVSLFKIANQFALPGSSLRGLISSVAEAASDSALRVLADSPLSISVEGRREPLGNAHAYFPLERRPLTFGDGRRSLSLAEQLFGVVEHMPEHMPDGQKKPEHWKAFSLASRVRFSNALNFGTPAEQTDTTRTQILASPKPMSHNFYHQPTSGPAYIPKGELHPNQHQAKGRKFFLHRSSQEGINVQTADPDDNIHQKADIAPLKSGEFWFHIDFDNLSNEELQLLCYSLDPTDDYHHKLGMGKPLGLGKIKIQPVALCLVDREKRYSSPSLNTRHHDVWRNESIHSWPADYQVEASSAVTVQLSPRALGRDWYTAADSSLKPILDALELIGNPKKVQKPVHYPQVAEDRNGKDIKEGTAAFETQHFKWWGANDQPNSAQQHLGSLLATTSLPELDRVTRRPPGVARPAAPPAPRPPAIPTEREHLKGGEHDFQVLKANARNDKLTFVYRQHDLYVEGSMFKPEERKKLLSQGIAEGQTIRLYVNAIAGSSAQLFLPPENPA